MRRSVLRPLLPSAAVDDAAPPEPTTNDRAVRAHLRRAWRIVGRLLALPLWLGVAFAGLGLAASWVLPYDFHEANALRRLFQTAGFLLRVFQFHLGLACLAAAGVGVVFWRKRLIVVALLVAVPVLAAEAWRATPRPTAHAADGETVRIASFNLFAYNRDFDAVAAEVARLDADVIVFQEFNPPFHSGLVDRLAPLYPHVLVSDEVGTRGKAVFGRRPLDPDAAHPSAAADGRRRFTLDLAGRPLAVALVHHRSPGGADTLARNFAQAASLAAGLADETGGLVAIGDFNASTWTPQLSLLRSAGLTEAHDATTLGRGATWPDTLRVLPTSAVDWGVGIRIDNAFVTGDLVPVASGVGRPVGSDHRPIWVDVARGKIE